MTKTKKVFIFSLVFVYLAIAFSCSFSRESCKESVRYNFDENSELGVVFVYCAMSKDAFLAQLFNPFGKISSSKAAYGYIIEDKNGKIVDSFRSLPNSHIIDDKYWVDARSNMKTIKDGVVVNSGYFVISKFNEDRAKEIQWNFWNDKELSDYNLHYRFDFIFDITEISQLRWPY